MAAGEMARPGPPSSQLPGKRESAETQMKSRDGTYVCGHPRSRPVPHSSRCSGVGARARSFGWRGREGWADQLPALIRLRNWPRVVLSVCLVP
jgi:hypothetical protein